MAWGAIAMAGLGFVSSVVQGNQQRSAADKQNKQQEAMAEAQYERDLKEWELNYLQSQSDYAWQVANVEAQRYQDRVAEQDYNAQQGRIIDAAMLNLSLNSEALRDQYETGEQLRRLQAEYEYTDKLNAETLTLENAMSTARTAAAETLLTTQNDVANYLNSIKQRGLQASALLSRKTNEGQAIQEQIVLSEKLDTLQRDAQYITALAEGANRKAVSVARGGGSNSSRRVAMDSMKRFGRSYGLLKNEQARRRSQLTNYNASLTGETSAELAQIANSIAGEARSIEYSKASNRVKLTRIAETARSAQRAFDLNTNSLMRNFNQLTLPSFDLAQRQGKREYTALLNSTYNQVAAASTPYRNSIIFDPLQPIAGLEPEKAMVTKVAKPGWGSILAGSAVEAAKGAMSMSYTDSNGNLAFR